MGKGNETVAISAEIAVLELCCSTASEARTLWLFLQAWYQYGAFCMRSKAHTRAEAAFKEALSLDQQHWPSAAALACLGLSMAQGKDLPDAPDPAAFGWVEVLSHTMKDAAGPAAALPWALLALLHRVQGE